MKFVAAAAVAAVTIMQLVRARDGTTDEELAEAFEPDDRPVLEALSAQLEGATAKQKNPHPKRYARLRRLGHCSTWRMDRLLRKARPKGDAHRPRSLPTHQIRDHSEAPRCVNRIAESAGCALASPQPEIRGTPDIGRRAPCTTAMV